MPHLAVPLGDGHIVDGSLLDQPATVLRFHGKILTSG
jgi:hypothetical protein